MVNSHQRRGLLVAEGYERVYVENDYWDGPVSGVADMDGTPCYFYKAYFAGADETDSGEYFVWPIDRSTLDAEIEHYRIFAEWVCNGGVGPHPGSNSKHPRFKELDDALALQREVPPGSQRRVAFWASFSEDQYLLDGPGYVVRWTHAVPS